MESDVLPLRFRSTYYWDLGLAVIATSQAIGSTEGIDRAHRRVIVAASFGAIFEWYDFCLLYTSPSPRDS